MRTPSLRMWRWAIFALASVPLAAPAAGQTRAWPYDAADNSDLVYVHARVNYALSPDWVRDWERRAAHGVSAWVSVGSVTNRRFLTDVRLRIDEGLGSGRFRFLYDLRWLDGEHVDTATLQQFLGMEGRIVGPLGATARIHPTSRKENVDALFGLVVADEARARFLRVSLSLDDFLYGDKNETGGVSVSEPVGVRWEGRYAAARWEAYSEGRYASGSRRVFPDSAASPVVAERWGGVEGSASRLRWLPSDDAYLELHVTHYAFTDGQRWRDGSSFDYGNEVLETGLTYVFSPASRVRAWPGVRVLRRRAENGGTAPYDVSRTDLMPSAFVQVTLGSSDDVQVGYMGSWSDRSRTGAGPERDFDVSRWADKAELAWTHRFSELARIQMSISQEIASGRFGGGNVQFLAFF